MPEYRTKKFRPTAYVPTLSQAGDEPESIILRGENMWIRSSRAGHPYAEGYTGNLDLSETIATKTMTGTLAYTSSTNTVTGTGTLFTTELRIGCFVFVDGGLGGTELLVVRKIVSDTSFICDFPAKSTDSGKTGYVMPVLFAVGTDRGTCVRGNVIQFPKGHYLGVGDGTFRVNGTAITVTGKTFADADVSVGNNTIAITGHGFSANERVQLTTTGVLPAGLALNTAYYVLYQSANLIKLSATVAGSAVDITAAAGGGTHTISTALGLSGTFGLSTLPQFAVFNPSAGTYVQNSVGIAKPTTSITVAAVSVVTSLATPTVPILDSSDATPIVITTTAAHGIYTGQQVYITGVTTNTNANGTWTATKLTSTTFSLQGSTGTGAGAGGATGTIAGAASAMQAGSYSIRVCAKNTSTLGFSQPSDVIAPVALTAGQSISVTFNSAMFTDQDAYDIYGTPFEDNATTTILGQYMGPWFLVKTVTAAMLVDNAHTTGRETGTSFIFSYTDGEIQTATQVLSFDNFTPVDAEFVDIMNGIPIYFSCLGKGSTVKLDGMSPGPVAIPSKPSNPEAVFKNKAITTAGGDYIIGEFNAKSRIYVLGQNTLQTIVLTTVDIEPIAFRSLWNCGFRNPYNVAFVKEYLYGDSTQGVVRSVAGGDDSMMEFEFASDMRDIFTGEPCGHKLVAYDPKNKAVCFFYSAAERRSNLLVTIVRPYLIEKGIWNPPIVLKKANTDFVVSGVATIGNQLVFLAGGRVDPGGAITVKTYVFDGGDSEAKDWYMAWNFNDSGEPYKTKTITGYNVNGQFASSSTRIDLHGVVADGAIDITGLASNSGTDQTTTIGTVSALSRKRFKMQDWGPYSLWTMRISGSHTTTADRLDKLEMEYIVNSDKN